MEILQIGVMKYCSLVGGNTADWCEEILQISVRKYCRLVCGNTATPLKPVTYSFTGRQGLAGHGQWCVAPLIKHSSNDGVLSATFPESEGPAATCAISR